VLTHVLHYFPIHSATQIRALLLKLELILFRVDTVAIQMSGCILYDRSIKTSEVPNHDIIGGF